MGIRICAQATSLATPSKATRSGPTAAPIANGIVLHRRIDSYADTAPGGPGRKSGDSDARARSVFRRRCGLAVRPLFGRRILPGLHPDEPLRAFAEAAQIDLLNRTVEMPARSQRFLHAMVAHDRLVQYGSRRRVILSVCRSALWMLGLSNAFEPSAAARAVRGGGFGRFRRPRSIVRTAFWMRIQTEARSFVQTESLLCLLNAGVSATFTAW